MQYIVCTSDIWWHSIDIIVIYQTAVMDVDKRLEVPYYEMPYIEREATATRCHNMPSDGFSDTYQGNKSKLASYTPLHGGIQNHGSLGPDLTSVVLGRWFLLSRLSRVFSPHVPL